jgi:hypothetical protein
MITENTTGMSRLETINTSQEYIDKYKAMLF